MLLLKLSPNRSIFKDFPHVMQFMNLIDFSTDAKPVVIAFIRDVPMKCHCFASKVRIRIFSKSTFLSSTLFEKISVLDQTCVKKLCWDSILFVGSQFRKASILLQSSFWSQNIDHEL